MTYVRFKAIFSWEEGCGWRAAIMRALVILSRLNTAQASTPFSKAAEACIVTASTSDISLNDVVLLGERTYLVLDLAPQVCSTLSTVTFWT